MQHRHEGGRRQRRDEEGLVGRGRHAAPGEPAPGPRDREHDVSQGHRHPRRDPPPRPRLARWPDLERLDGRHALPVIGKPVPRIADEIPLDDIRAHRRGRSQRDTDRDFGARATAPGRRVGVPSPRMRPVRLRIRYDRRTCPPAGQGSLPAFLTATVATVAAPPGRTRSNASTRSCAASYAAAGGATLRRTVVTTHAAPSHGSSGCRRRGRAMSGRRSGRRDARGPQGFAAMRPIQATDGCPRAARACAPSST